MKWKPHSSLSANIRRCALLTVFQVAMGPLVAVLAQADLQNLTTEKSALSDNTTIVMNPGKNDCGVYITAEDFLTHKLSFPNDCCSKKQRHIKVRPGRKIILYNNHAKRIFRKSDLFGFRACEGIEYRLYLEDKYEIVNKNGFFLYRQEVDVGAGDIICMDTIYYFSREANSIIYPLSKQYLTWVFRGNKLFVALINSAYGKRDHLTDVDKESDKYKIVLMYEKSMLEI